jgi:hypothetical protein
MIRTFLEIWQGATHKRKIAMIVALIIGWPVILLVEFQWWLMDTVSSNLDRFDNWLDT